MDKVVLKTLHVALHLPERILRFNEVLLQPANLSAHIVDREVGHVLLQLSLLGAGIADVSSFYVHPKVEELVKGVVNVL